MTKADDSSTSNEPDSAKRKTVIESRHLAEKILDDSRRAEREAKVVWLPSAAPRPKCSTPRKSVCTCLAALHLVGQIVGKRPAYPAHPAGHYDPSAELTARMLAAAMSRRWCGPCDGKELELALHSKRTDRARKRRAARAKKPPQKRAHEAT